MIFQKVPDKMFSFKYNNDRTEDSYYDVVVVVNEIENKNYYDIKYQYYFRKGKTVNTPQELKRLKIFMHPYYLRGGLTQYNTDTNNNNIDGIIVPNNPLSTMMINYLEMGDKDLKLYCKDSTTQKYRQKIMIALCYFSK